MLKTDDEQDKNLEDKNIINESALNASGNIHVGNIHHHHAPQQVVVPPTVIFHEKSKPNLLLLVVILFLGIGFAWMSYHFSFKEAKQQVVRDDSSNTSPSPSNRHQDVSPKVKIKNNSPITPQKNVPDSPKLSKLSVEEEGKIFTEFLKGKSIPIKGNEHIKSFNLNQYEVTVGRYLAFCQKIGHPFPFDKVDTSKSSYPMRFVSWEDANAYCIAMGGRLPSAAEWELAAKQLLGADTILNEATISHVAWNRFNSGGCPHPVGQKLIPNVLRLYDLFGNVYEWCADGPKDGLKYIAGGHYNGLPQKMKIRVEDFCRAAYPNETIGFRVVY